VLFLLCVSRFVLFLLCVYGAFYCSCTKHIAGCVPTFANPSKTRGLVGSGGFGGHKKAGASLP
jgi:hypothetical protein